MKSTLRCVRCGKSAVTWSGYVVHGKSKYLAGWCQKCLVNTGFCGHYRSWMMAPIKHPRKAGVTTWSAS